MTTPAAAKPKRQESAKTRIKRLVDTMRELGLPVGGVRHKPDGTIEVLIADGQTGQNSMDKLLYGEGPS